jgi:hypothetical protein
MPKSGDGRLGVGMRVDIDKKFGQLVVVFPVLGLEYGRLLKQIQRMPGIISRAGVCLPYHCFGLLQGWQRPGDTASIRLSSYPDQSLDS